MNIFKPSTWGQDKNSVYLRRPRNVPDDKTDSIAANTAALFALYKGTNPQNNLASPVVSAPIDTLRALVGAPVFTGGNPGLTEKLNIYAGDESPLITTAALICGTAWVFPRLIQGKLVWEQIRDDEVEGVEQDSAGAITAIYTSKTVTELERQTLTRAAETVFTINRRIDREKIVTEFIGKKTRTEIVDNFFQVLPLPFAHDALPGSWRGCGAFTRIWRTAKAFHDVIENQAKIVATFKPKLIATLRETALNGADKDGVDIVADFISTRLGASAGDGRANIMNSQFVGLLKGSDGIADEVRFEYLSSDSINAAKELAATLYRHIVAGSGIHEVFWPPIMTQSGNYASAQVATQMGIKSVQNIQREFTKFFDQLGNVSMRIMAYMDSVPAARVNVTWSRFDMLSPVEKADRLNTIASALNTIYTGGALSLEDIFYFAKEAYPELPETDAEQLAERVRALADEKSFRAGGAEIV